MRVLSMNLIEKLAGKARSIEEIADKAGVHRNNLGAFLRRRGLKLEPKGYKIVEINQGSCRVEKV